MKIQKITPVISFTGKKNIVREIRTDIPSYDECYDSAKKELRVRVPVEGYKAYYVHPPRIHHYPIYPEGEADYEDIIIKKGKAYHYDGRRFDGDVLFKDKTGRAIQFTYDDGTLESVFVNGEATKGYFDLDYREALDYEEFCYNHEFADGTKLDDTQFWNMDGVKYRVVQDLKTGKESFIRRNTNPSYKDEPILNFVSGNKKSSVLNKSDIKKVEFYTKEEASEYFEKEYGIDAEFINLKQAHLLKDAVDDFAVLDYQGKGKRLFEGMVVRVFNDDDKTAAGVVVVGFPLKEASRGKDPSTYDIYDLDFEKHDEQLKFNASYDWSTLEDFSKQNFYMGFHPYSLSKHLFTHELAHFLHLKNSPKLYFMSDSVKPTEQNIAAIRSVSIYATQDMSEFVAEYVAGRMSGAKYSKETEALYHACGGPDLFKD